MKFSDLKNADELRQELVDMLIDFAKESHPYDTDVNLYVDENNNGKLCEFMNPGGNLWLNDDHYTIYTDKQHNDCFLDYFTSKAEIADALEMELEDLLTEVWDNTDAPEWYDDIWDISYDDVCDYVKEKEEYNKKLLFVYVAFLYEQEATFEDTADAIIEQFDEDQEFIKQFDEDCAND